MNFSKECFKEHNGALTEQLKVTGFSADQAQQFLLEAATGILGSTRDSGGEQIAKELVSGDPSQFLNLVNLDVMAEKPGMNSDQVAKGLAVIAPILATGLFKRFS